MPNLDLVGIVIPNLNGGRFLRDAIETALANRVGRVVIADNNSEDDSLAIARSYSARFGNVQVVQELRRGTGWSKNAGVHAAIQDGAQFIIVLDSDNWIDPDYAKICLAAVDVSTAVVAPGIRIEAPDTDRTQMPKSPITVSTLLQENRLFCSSMFRSECWETVGGYDCREGFFYDDWDFWIRLAALGYKFVAVNKPLLHHRIHPNQITTRLRDRDTFQKQYLAAKHADLAALWRGL